jgi:hypothetical protein
MQIFDVKTEIIVSPKKCACCKKTVEANNPIYYGHSNFKNPNGDCSSYVCEECAGTMQGYILDCFCGDEI